MHSSCSYIVTIVIIVMWPDVLFLLSVPKFYKVGLDFYHLDIICTPYSIALNLVGTHICDE